MRPRRPASTRPPRAAQHAHAAPDDLLEQPGVWPIHGRLLPREDRPAGATIMVRSGFSPTWSNAPNVHCKGEFSNALGQVPLGDQEVSEGELLDLPRTRRRELVDGAPGARHDRGIPLPGARASSSLSGFRRVHCDPNVGTHWTRSVTICHTRGRPDLKGGW